MRNKRIGITTTVPSEFIFASGAIPVDLNNIFVTDINAPGFIETAEIDGIPRTACAWIKGMYGAALEGKLDAIVGVSEGDCSHTRSLLEILQSCGMKTIPFAYPYSRDRELLKLHMEKFANSLGVSFQDAETWMRRLDRIRAKLREIDRLTWEENRVSGFENHLLQVSASDMDGDPNAFEEKCERFISASKTREPFPQEIRLAFIGVPPIIGDLYDFLETRNARVVYNEVQRQFAFPNLCEDIVDRYLDFTYPYDVFGRIEDIKTEITRRGIHGIIHYSQSFCHRQMEDVILRKAFKDMPFITVEGDAPQAIDARTKLRIESFCELLAHKTETSQRPY